jgi:hypothetical protein
VFSCIEPQRLLSPSPSRHGKWSITLANGAHHYRLLGLEITGTANDPKTVTALFTNSIITSRESPIWSTGAFQEADCARS